MCYLNDDIDVDTRNTAVSFLPGGAGSLREILDGDYVLVQRSISNDYAIFGDASFDITSDLTLSVGGRYTRNENDWDIEAVVLGNVNYRYQDAMFFGPDNTRFEPDYGVIDVRVGIGSASGKWQLIAYARNLDDELHRVSMLPFIGDEVSSFAAPRTYGMKYTMNL